MGKFCFLCGKKSEDLKDGYCFSCFEKQIKLVKLPQKIKLSICNYCGKIKFKGRWHEKEAEDLFMEKIKLLVKDAKIDVKLKGKVFHVIVTEKIGNNIIRKEYDVNGNINKVKCADCLKRGTGYHQAIIQLRGDYKKILLTFEDQLDLQLEKHPREFYRKELTKNGIDYFLSKKSMAASLAESMNKKFDIKVKRSRKLITKKKGKDIYRDVFSLRI